MTTVRYDSDGTRLYVCARCHDTGFERGDEFGHALTCSGNGMCGIGQCGREGNQNYAHTYTRKCRCRATNAHLAELRRQHAESHASQEHPRRHAP